MQKLLTQSRVKGTTLGVLQPHITSTYSKGMGSVDILDCLSTAYRSSIRCKKWYSRSYQFGKHVTLTLLNCESPSPEREPQLSAFLGNESRFDRMNHTIVPKARTQEKVRLQAFNHFI